MTAVWSFWSKPLWSFYNLGWPTERHHLPLLGTVAEDG